SPRHLFRERQSPDAGSGRDHIEAEGPPVRCGDVPATRRKCVRNEVAVPKPHCWATISIGRSVASRSRWAWSTRWRSSHCMGGVPVTARNRRGGGAGRGGAPGGG